MSQLLHHIQLRQLLSFDETGIDLPLRSLNVLVGPNGSGKSNLIEAISLLQSAPRDLAATIREGGGIGEWLWKGVVESEAWIGVAINVPSRTDESLWYELAFAESSQRLELTREHVCDGNLLQQRNQVNIYYLYAYIDGRHILEVDGKLREVPKDKISLETSIFVQRKDPERYPEITRLGEAFDRIRIYREWSFGRDSILRQPRKADERNDFLNEDCGNLGLILNRLRRDAAAKESILENLAALYPSVTDFDVSIEGGTVQVFLQEGRFSIPASRLSDGTLRFLCLLAILCHPQPPPLVCLEEPELGLHPDVIVSVGTLLKEASTRTQLIVTTHSDILIDCLSGTPEDVVVCEKPETATRMQRLDASELSEWLETYSLGQLWRRGEIGGNRW